MVLAGKLSTEIGIKAPAAKFYDLFAKQLHDVQNHCERVHHTKLHEGEDWHEVGSALKHWTYVIDGEVHTCQERIESVDEENKTIKYSLFDGDIGQHYKTFLLTLQVIENKDGHDTVKWTVEYEMHHEEKEPPHGWMEYVHKCTRDIDANLLKA
ncbi:MLP-like protein 34 [Lotus japonicus]|uniref:MLP-like protein 34 n=1 Tax=Lotus japonicus TaxID=34305 RepID=UPI0025836C40|nr:MLP-like protein 34 [Lotus japonicus]